MPRNDLIQVRRDTAANWAAMNPVLAAAEPGLATDTGAEKIGDGVTAWSALPMRQSGTYARRRMYNVKDYWTGEIGASVNAALAAAAADAYAYGKPGQVVIPPGDYAQTVTIVPVSGVDLIGSGWGKTVLRPQGNMASIKLFATSSVPLRDVMFADFEIDGSGQSGAYDVGMKGFFTLYNRRVVWDHLYIHDAGATGLGSDFMDDCVINDVVAVGCGRLNDGSGPGGAGIGIGVRGFATERCVISNVVTRNNIRAGLFFESQAVGQASGYEVTNLVSEGNQTGLGDAGCDGLTVTNASLRGNTTSGFKVYTGTIGLGTPGVNGRLTNVVSLNNGEHGFLLDDLEKHGCSGYTIVGCLAKGNTLSGVAISLLNTNVDTLTVADTAVVGNGQDGIRYTSTGTGVLTGTVLSDVRAEGNTGVGIYVGKNTTGLDICGGRATANQHGLSFAPGVTLTSSRVDGIDLRGNTTGPVSNPSVLGSGAVVGAVPGYTVNAGAPEGAVVAPVGTMYRRTDGGAGTALYVKELGVTSTGWSPVNTTPPATTAPNQVTGLGAVAGDTQVVLSWSTPLDGRSPITDYIVQYRTTAGPGAWTTFSDGTSTATSATVTGLTNGTSYDFQVAAVNAIGTGTYSAASTATPAGAAFDPLTALTWAAAYYAADPSWSNPGDGNGVSSWRDGSGNSRTLTQATSSMQPLYVASESTLNNKPCLSFDGANDFLTSASFTQGQTFSVVAVLSGFVGSSASRHLFAAINGPDAARIFALDTFYGARATTLAMSSIAPSATKQLFVFRFNNSPTGALNRNGTANNLDVSPGTGSIASGFNLAARADGTAPGIAKVAFFAIYNGDVTADANWATFKSWVASNYGITIA